MDLESTLQGHETPDLRDLSLPSMYDDILLLVHPWVAPTFVSVVDPDWSSPTISDQINREVARVVGNHSQWNVRYEFVGTDVILGERVDRILVTCIPDAALSVGKLMGAATTDVKCTVAAIASLISAQSLGRHGLEVSGGVVTAIGVYGDRIEISLHDAGSLRFSGFLANVDSDSATRRIDAMMVSIGMQPAQLSSVLLYGHPDVDWSIRDSDLFSESQIDRLDPSDIFGQTSRDVTNDSAFAPVAAGAFNRLLSHV